MQALPVVLLVVAAVASLPIEARLWRAGRLSDAVMTTLLLGRLPVVVLLFGLIQGYVLPITIGATALMLVPRVFMYRYVSGLLQAHRPSVSIH